jgi:hypothetical protein
MEMDSWGKRLVDELDKHVGASGLSGVNGVDDGIEVGTAVPGEPQEDASIRPAEGEVHIFKRPPGRPPKNKVWDPHKGQYVPRVFESSSISATSGIAPTAAEGHDDSADMLMHQSMEVDEPSEAPDSAADSVASVNGVSGSGTTEAMQTNEPSEAPDSADDSVASVDGASGSGTTEAMQANEPSEAPDSAADRVASVDGASGSGTTEAMQANASSEAPDSAADSVASVDGASGSESTTAASADIVHAAASTGSTESSASQVDEVEADPKVSEVRGELGCIRNTLEALKNNKRRACDDDDDETLKALADKSLQVKV